ncbi:helix-turn-helix domain-containing protein [Antarcticirhabdus aurantiaca]|uniref:Helix-turn-helix domain-containing protein n=1 Tax=Antarcticirhabdus aurantiaca TaxID=2606717 RepID=A0ACD4NQV2_9HYPH|nr:helix-turn-helix domain-containing protein [Jeongeuplla avenae]
MTPIRFIRQHVFRLTQTEFAALAGVRQSSVSRWESGGPLDSIDMLHIRNAAFARSLPWNDSWFFDVPAAREDGVDDAAIEVGCRVASPESVQHAADEAAS